MSAILPPMKTMLRGASSRCSREGGGVDRSGGGLVIRVLLNSLTLKVSGTLVDECRYAFLRIT